MGVLEGGSKRTVKVFFLTAGEGGTGVNYHLQYVEPQEIYTTQNGHDGHM